jgi:hypothetical protein
MKIDSKNLEGLNKDPCKKCKRREEDSYGMVCNLWCGKHTYYVTYMYGVDSLLKLLQKGISDGNGGYYFISHMLKPSKNSEYCEIIDEDIKS